jgi:hypothetical protein
MLSNRLAFAALGVACVAAAAGGGYLASRHNAAQVASLEAVEALEATTAPAAAPLGPSVQETEAVVTAAGPARAEARPPVRQAPAASRSEQPPARPAPRPSRAPEPAPVTPPPALERSWPSANAPVAPLPSPEPPVFEPVSERPAEHADAQVPPPPTFDELIVPADSVVGLQIESSITSESALVEDRVTARVVRDVRAGGEVAIAAGTRALGVVTLVERGGKFKERARVGIRFHTLVLADGARLPVTTETIYRYGEEPGNSSAAKIGGGAVAGAILGAILGGAKGAAVGAGSGAGAGTAVVMAGDRSAATFAAGTELTARMLSPVSVTIQR